MKKNYRWGILGAGRIADKFCQALCFVEGSEVYAVASRDIHKAKMYADKYNATTFYNNYNDLLNDENIDIIYIATPHAFHYEQTMLCLKNKKAVLCEKPMSLSWNQTSEMIAFAKQNNLFLMEGIWTSCMPFIDKILSLIKEDVIGEPQYVSADFGFSAPLSLDSRSFNKTLGGGSVLDIGIYPIFLTTLILGEPCTIKTISKLTITEVDEYANVILQYPKFQIAHLLSTISFNTPIEAEIIGTKGRIKIDNPWFKATDFSVYLNDGTTQHFSIPHLCNGFEHEIKEVMHCLDNGLLQSNKVPHKLSLSVSKTMDEILRQAGVSFE
ncbi:MAG: Gfo/Idh/MocA family oxidoreductase [Bacteroidota bacterium]|nr:Gfo/Idh/MocA family oxidoreductase [Bacteroidota bacterium]